MSEIEDGPSDKSKNDHAALKIVLLVEDHLETREALSILLRQNGMDVIEAADGIEALNAILMKSPDLILTDLRMPNMDGLELSKHVKASAEFKHIPIVLITATPLSDRTKHPEIALFLQKPYPAAELVIAISKFL